MGNEIDLEAFKSKFKLLRRRVIDIQIDNRKLLKANEKDAMTRGKPKTYSMEVPDGELTADKQYTNHAFDLMKYTMREYEEWEKSQENSGKNSDKTNNFVNSSQQIAKFTYDKELKKLSKANYLENKNGPGRTFKIKKNVDNGKIVIHDDKKLISKLADSLNKSAHERYNKSNKASSSHSSTSGFINDKNKDFNKKLNREMEKLEKKD